MYKLLIVDDEEYVRNGIANRYDWRGFGFRIAGTAGSGREALELVGRLHPHVVLTDIRMPGMSGLEFAETLRGRFPAVHIVLLSAYHDFLYAQTAIKFGVKGYLTKPVDEAELTALFRQLSSQLGENPPAAAASVFTSESEERGNAYVSRAKHFIMEHYEQKITLEDVAKHLYLSPAYFSVAFKKETGQNLIDYITQVKVGKAKEWLQRSDYKVKEIALRLGYDDYTYFCKIFRKATGLAPLEYRSKHLK